MQRSGGYESESIIGVGEATMRGRSRTKQRPSTTLLVNTLLQCCIQNFKSGAPYAYGSHKMGPMLQNVGAMIFVSCHFVKSRINRILNVGTIWLQVFVQILGTYNI